mgnify:FL=1
MFGPRRSFGGVSKVSPPYAQAVETLFGDGVEITEDVAGPYACELTGLAPSEWRALTPTERARWVGYAEGKRLAQMMEARNGRGQTRHPGGSQRPRR